MIISNFKVFWGFRVFPFNMCTWHMTFTGVILIYFIFLNKYALAEVTCLTDIFPVHCPQSYYTLLHQPIEWEAFWSSETSHFIELLEYLLSLNIFNLILGRKKFVMFFRKANAIEISLHWLSLAWIKLMWYSVKWGEYNYSSHNKENATVKRKVNFGE